MNNNFILKDDGKIYWIQDMPEPIEPSKAKWVVNGKTIYSYGLACKEYEKALQSAISNAVEVSNQEEVFVALARDNEWDDWYRCEGGVKEYMTLGAVYSLQCSVEKLELMRENDGNPVVHSVKALVTFPESGNKTEQETPCQQCSSLKEENEKWRIGWNQLQETLKAQKEENERLKADIKTIGQILKDGGWIDLFEKIIALNPTPKTEGTSI
jgi:hypothetical protein